MRYAYRTALCLALGVGFFLASTAPCQAQLGGVTKVFGAKKKTLKLKHIAPELVDLPLGEIKFKGTKYSKIGEGRYDAFFRSTAVVQGLVDFDQKMTTSATGSLKKFAMSKAADEALGDAIKELVGDTPPEEWTTEQQIAVLKIADHQDKVSKDEKVYFLKTAGALTLGAAALTKALATTKSLTEEGLALQKSVGDLPKIKVVAATDATKHSIENLKTAAQQGPPLAEEMVVLATGFKALGGGEEEGEGQD